MCPRDGNDTEKIDVAYVAHLARLHLTESEAAELQGEIEKIVHYVEQLRDLDLGEIEPTAHAVPMFNVLREDAVRPSLDHEKAMANAPEQRGGSFVVPRIIE